MGNRCGDHPSGRLCYVARPNSASQSGTAKASRPRKQRAVRCGRSRELQEWVRATGANVLRGRGLNVLYRCDSDGYRRARRALDQRLARCFHGGSV